MVYFLRLYIILLCIYTFLHSRTFFYFVLSFHNSISLSLCSFFYNLLNCIKYHNNKLKSSLLDASSARLTNNLSTSLSQRLSLAHCPASIFFTCSQNGPPSFGSDGLESSLSNFSSNHTLVEVIHDNGSGMPFPSHRW